MRRCNSNTCFLISIVCMFSRIACKEWLQCTTLDTKGKYHTCWNIMQDSGEIEFQVEVETHGYFGFGLSLRGTMAGSDMVTGWVKDGEIHFQGRHGKGHFLPEVDILSNWHLISGKENDTHTTFVFHRKLDTCDKNDVKMDESTMKLIYAYSDVDPSSKDNMKYHLDNRGWKNVFLLQRRKQKSLEELDKTLLSHWDILAPNISLPVDVDTLYFCKLYKSPEITEKKHIVILEPVFQKGSEALIHHMILHECVGADPDEFEPHINEYGYECHYGSMPGVMRKCEGYFIGWQFGSAGTVFPENIGIPLDPGLPRYYRMEIHYNNPTKKKGIVDQSGFRIYYTNKLREYDAGILMIGSIVSPVSFVPPKQETFVVTSHTSSECFDPALPPEGIKILAIGPHAHSIAYGFKTRHFRNGTELPPLAEDNNFDTKYQETRHLNKEEVFLPGDQITMECTYDSSERTSVTFGGETISDEMCLAFILYYPRIDRYASLSLPQYGVINKALGNNFSEDDLESGRFTAVISKFNWTTVNIGDVQKTLRYGLHDTMCLVGNGTRTSNKNPVSYPEYFRPFQKAPTCVPQEDVKMNEIQKFMM